MEKLTLKYDGNNSVDAAQLATSILNFSRAIQQIAKNHLGDNNVMKVSVSAFEDGSLDAVTVLEIWDKTQNMALAVAPVIPQIISTLVDTIDIIKFLKGSSPKKLKQNQDGTINVTNAEGDTGNFSQRAFLNFGDTNITYNISQFYGPTISDVRISSQSLLHNGENISSVSKEESTHFEKTDDTREEEVTIIGIVYDINTDTHNGKIIHSGTKTSINFKSVFDKEPYYTLIKSLKWKAPIKITGMATINMSTTEYKKIEILSATIMQDTIFDEES